MSSVTGGCRLLPLRHMCEVCPSVFALCASYTQSTACTPDVLMCVCVVCVYLYVCVGDRHVCAREGNIEMRQTRTTT